MKKFIVLLLVVVILVGTGLGKYHQAQNEKRIQTVQSMLHPNYGSLTLDQALRNSFGRSPEYLSGKENTVIMVIPGGYVTMTFTVDLDHNRVFVDSCWLYDNEFTNPDTIDAILNEIYSG